jgi:hypothetical protein
VRVVCVLLAVVSKECVRRDGFRRIPALKILVVFYSWFGVVVWLSGPGCLDRGASEEVVWVSCSMGHFRL